jgi:hypothetical protein
VIDGGERLVFDAEAEGELAAAVAAEREDLMLDVAGPPDARPVVAEFFA